MAKILILHEKCNRKVPTGSAQEALAPALTGKRTNPYTEARTDNPGPIVSPASTAGPPSWRVACEPLCTTCISSCEATTQSIQGEVMTCDAGCKSMSKDT
ncbi:MAG: hypothetical protein G01um101438_914 [Parcubacteria group bacterium Gr01-1014_38]|nr:MAG: hypothetical protein G01um101438_914 [Parcubacteria group bacterium Gr01-1014_38]